METTSWLMPLILLPGVALLIMSTSMRYSQIHGELHHLLDDEERVSVLFCQHLRQRARLFRNALMGLYISVALLAVGSIVGAIIDLLHGHSEWVVAGFALAGIVALICSAVTLIQESRFSLEVIEHHLQMIGKRGDDV